MFAFTFKPNKIIKQKLCSNWYCVNRFNRLLVVMLIKTVTDYFKLADCKKINKLTNYLITNSY